MRAFKHITKNEDLELRKEFPISTLEDINDNDAFTRIAISLWDKWYQDVIDKENEPPFDCSDKEEQLRYEQIASMTIDIVEKYEVYGIFYNKRNRLKKVRCKKQLIADLKRDVFLSRNLVIPSLRAIYTVTWDFTVFIYCKNEDDVQPLIDIALSKGLKQIKYT